MITVTLIRHGESEDNIKAVWAGWKDSPLSNLGQQQAKALGSSFAPTTRFTHLYSSDLLRAHSTAQAVLDSHPEPKPLLSTTPNLREQHFGIAEGGPWTPTQPPKDKTPEELYKQGIFPQPLGRGASFPEGESLDDVAQRVAQVIRECILPHLFDKTRGEAHIGLASHGICITELISVLLKMDPEADCTIPYKGHINTAWTRLEIALREPHEDKYDPNCLPPLRVRLITFNNYDHLASLPPPIMDENQVKAFFAGKDVSMTNGKAAIALTD